MTYTVKEISIETYQDFQGNSCFTYTVLISGLSASTVGTGPSLKKAIKDALNSIEYARQQKEIEEWTLRQKEEKRGKTVSKKR
jgi:hypothetical protein